MKRIKLQEGKSPERKVIYEGKGVCKVMKGGRLVERLQLEKGDNLLEALKGGKLMEGSFKPTNYKESGGIDGAKSVLNDGDEFIYVAGSEDDGYGLVIGSNSDEYSDTDIQIDGLDSQEEAEKVGEDISKKIGLKNLLDLSESGISRKLKSVTSKSLDVMIM